MTLKWTLVSLARMFAVREAVTEDGFDLLQCRPLIHQQKHPYQFLIGACFDSLSQGSLDPFFDLLDDLKGLDGLVQSAHFFGELNTQFEVAETSIG